MSADAPFPLPAILGGPAEFPAGIPQAAPDPAIRDVLLQAWETGDWSRYAGAYGERLTSAIAERHQVAHVLLCASGTAAVELALRGLKIGPGDEVLQPAYDFQGNFKDVLTVGARPVLCDIDRATGTLDPETLAAGRSPQTRVILVSHLHGGVANLPAIVDWARDQGLKVIEDASQMPGAVIAGRPAGTWGDVGIWSFGGSKLLSAGRGGALFTNDAQVAQRCRLYTQRGNEAYPLSELQSAVLLPQLEQLTERRSQRNRQVHELTQLLTAESGLTPFECHLPNSEADFYKLGLWYDSSRCAGLSRSQFAAALQAEGIPLDAGFRSLHLSHAASRFRAAGELPVATRADTEILVLHHSFLELSDSQANARFLSAIEKIRHWAVAIRSCGETSQA